MKKNNNFDYNEIINNEEFKKMLNSNDFEKVYELLRDYSLKISLKYSFNSELQTKLRDRLFIYYLMFSTHKLKKRNLFEKVLIKLGSNLNEDILEYLLSQELDMNYIGYDMYENPTTLIDDLALHIDKTNLMKMILSKISGINRKTFGNNNYGLYTDLCRMNIIAGNMDEAIKLFNEEEYYLFLNNIDDSELSIKLAKEKNGIYVNDFNGDESDILFQIIKTLNLAEIDKNIKADFLNKILYNKKIKLFNVANFEIIKSIMNKEEYQKFIEYLYDMVNSNKITAFSTGNHKNIIFYESLTTLTKKPKYL